MRKASYVGRRALRGWRNLAGHALLWPVGWSDNFSRRGGARFFDKKHCFFTFRHQPGEPGQPRGLLLVLKHVHCTLQKTASRSVGFQGSRSPKSKLHQCIAFSLEPHPTGRWRRPRTTRVLGSYRGRAPQNACHSKTTAASDLKLGVRRVQGHSSMASKRQCRSLRGTRPFRLCAESNFGRPSTAIRLPLVRLRNTPLLRRLGAHSDNMPEQCQRSSVDIHRLATLFHDEGFHRKYPFLL